MARGNVWPRTRKDGSTAYMVRCEMPPDPRTGERKRRVATFDTRREAKKTLTAWLADLDRATLSVRQSVVILAGKDGEKARPVIQEPKSQAAKRTIDLDPPTVAALRSHKDRQAFQRRSAAFWEDYDLVFSTGNGRVLNPNNVLRNFDAIVERASVPRIGVHDLRHTHATFLLLDGVPVTLVSKRLGHAKVNITLDTYSHILPGFEHRVVESIGAALFGGQSA